MMSQRSVICLFAFGTILLACPATAGEFYADSSAIDLVAFRDNVATSSIKDNANGTKPEIANRMIFPGGPVGWDIRMPRDAAANNTAWWQIQFANTYKVDTYEFYLYGPGSYKSLTYRVETSMNGRDWIDQTGDLSYALDYPYPLTGTFKDATGAKSAVEANFVRLTVVDYEWNGTGISTAILRTAHLFGPNEIAVNSNLSLAQAAWNGGVKPTMSYVNSEGKVVSSSTGGTTEIRLTDGFLGSRANATNGKYNTLVSGAPGTVALTVPLDDVYSISSVALAVCPTYKPQEVQIWCSLDGDIWTPATAILPFNSIALTIAGLDNYTINFADDIDAQFVRFDFRGSQREDMPVGTAEPTYIIIEQLYVYGTFPVPEPATMTLLALGGVALLRRRRT